MSNHITRTEIHSREMPAEGTKSPEVDVSCSSGIEIINGLEQLEWSKCEGDEIIDLKRGEIVVESGLRRD